MEGFPILEPADTQQREIMRIVLTLMMLLHRSTILKTSLNRHINRHCYNMASMHLYENCYHIYMREFGTELYQIHQYERIWQWLPHSSRDMGS
jgi:hypothetical protein